MTWRVEASFVFKAVCLIALAGNCSRAQPQDARITVFPNEQIGISRLVPGVTLTQTSWRGATDTASANAARAELKAVGGYVNQFIMGWGAHNPEPSPDHYDWDSLDFRVAEMLKSDAIPVLTLCCAPDWMKGGHPGETDLKRTDEAPDPAHFDDYVALVRQVALRYPLVKHYQIWSEYKGFWKSSRPAHWDYENYVILYNKIYDTLKSISPEIQTGGPYAIMDHWQNKGEFFHSTIKGPYGFIDKRPLEAIEYWLAHKHGADWISIDGGITGKDGFPDNLFAAGSFFADTSNWVRSRTDLPLWWSEWYSTPFAAPSQVDDAEQNALMSSALIMLAPVASVALGWGPEGDVRRVPENRESLWSDTTKPDGGKPYPFYFSLTGFRRCFPAGTKLVRATASEPGIALLASTSCAMIVNQRNDQIQATVNGEPIKLDRYETKFQPIK